MKAEYVVLSETSAMHLVCVRWRGEPWLRVVAAFQNKDRADAYADIEAMMLDDGTSPWESELLPDDAPTHDEPASTLPDFVSAMRTALVPHRPPVEATEEITREPKQAKALRAEKAPKEITLEENTPAPPVVTTAKPQEPADSDPDETTTVTTPAPTADDLTERDERLRELWATDLTLHQIADDIGLHFTTISQRAKKLGLPSRKGKGWARRTSEQRPPLPEVDPPSTPEVEGSVDRAPDDGQLADTPVCAPNGHIFTLHGVSLSNDTISFNGKEMWINDSQYRLLLALLRAAPHPIGVPHLLGKVYPGKRREESETVFGIVVKDLSKNLPHVDLGLNEMKGIGIALTGSNA